MLKPMNLLGKGEKTNLGNIAKLITYIIDKGN
jgi:hypothetical protein